jgi:hypothetical protein
VWVLYGSPLWCPPVITPDPPRGRGIERYFTTYYVTTAVSYLRDIGYMQCLHAKKENYALFAKLLTFPNGGGGGGGLAFAKFICVNESARLGERAERAFSVHDSTPPRSNTGHSCGGISTYPHQTFGERGLRGGGGVQY